MEVTLKKTDENDIENQVCEILVSVPGERQFVKKRSSSIGESLRNAIDAMSNKLVKIKTKKVNQSIKAQTL